MLAAQGVQNSLWLFQLGGEVTRGGRFADSCPRRILVSKKGEGEEGRGGEGRGFSLCDAFRIRVQALVSVRLTNNRTKSARQWDQQARNKEE